MSEAPPERCREFDCLECGRHIVVVFAPAWIQEDLCGLCIHHPGWFHSDVLRGILDPDHDGRDRSDRCSS